MIKFFKPFKCDPGRNFYAKNGRKTRDTVPLSVNVKCKLKVNKFVKLCFGEFTAPQKSDTYPH